MLKNVGLILAALVLTANTDAAVPRRSVPDEQIVAQAELVASGTYMEIYQYGVAIDPSFLKVMERAYEQVQRVTGLKLDTATLGPTVRVYVSDAIRVSHVWRGYQHPTDPKAIIFLNLRAYHGAMGGDNATHVHELTRHDETGSAVGFNGPAPAQRLLFCKLPIRQVSNRTKRHGDFLETLCVRESGDGYKSALRFRENRGGSGCP